MKKYIDVLKRTGLFAGISQDEILIMLNCLGAQIKKYKKGEYVLRAGEFVNKITLLLEGKLLIQKEDYWGNRSIINAVEPGEMFGEAYSAPNSGALSNDVVAIEESAVLSFDLNKLLCTCPSSCRFHSLTIQNLFFTLCEKNRNLVKKIGITSKRTTREKLTAYLSEEAKRQNKQSFEIPFNRQQLADYLCVDRSAMSNELSKMRDDGLIEFDKNKFILLYNKKRT